MLVFSKSETHVKEGEAADELGERNQERVGGVPGGGSMGDPGTLLKFCCGTWVQFQQADSLLGTQGRFMGMAPLDMPGVPSSCQGHRDSGQREEVGVGVGGGMSTG